MVAVNSTRAFGIQILENVSLAFILGRIVRRASIKVSPPRRASIVKCVRRAPTELTARALLVGSARRAQTTAKVITTLDVKTCSLAFVDRVATVPLGRTEPTARERMREAARCAKTTALDISIWGVVECLLGPPRDARTALQGRTG
jgi:hypothetical protein